MAQHNKREDAKSADLGVPEWPGALQNVVTAPFEVSSHVAIA
jgi:hypothetical protein